MLDPVSIVAVIGLALQCTQLLLDGFKGVRQQAKTVRECEARLRHHEARLNLCQMFMLNWCYVWGFPDRPSKPPLFSDETLKYFWGQATFERVLKQLGDIAALLNSIETRLTGQNHVDDGRTPPRKLQKRTAHLGSLARSDPSSPQPQEEQPPPSPTAKQWKEWTELTGSLRKSRDQRLNIRDSTIMYRISFALFRSEELQKDIDALEQLTRDINASTNGQFNARRRKGPQKSVDHGDVKDSELLRRRVSSLTEFAQRLYSIRGIVRGSWSLELRHPDTRGDATKWRNAFDINLDFTVHHHSQSTPEILDQQGCRRIRICYNPSIDQDELFKYILGMVQNVRPDALPQRPARPTTVEELPRCERLSRPLRSLFADPDYDWNRAAKFWEHDRAFLLVGVVNWITLLFNTPWTDHVCCCDIRFERLPDRKLQYVLSTMNTDNCKNTVLRQRKFLLLAIVLSEIILRRPLQLSLPHLYSILGPSTTSEDENASRSTANAILEQLDVAFDPSQGYTPSWTTVHCERLLQEIEEKTSAKVADAVKFCFENSTLAEGDDFRPETTLDLIQNVLEPIASHFRIIDEHRQGFSATPWWRSLIALYKWPSRESFDPKETCSVKVARASTDIAKHLPGGYPNADHYRMSREREVVDGVR